MANILLLNSAGDVVASFIVPARGNVRKVAEREMRARNDAVDFDIIDC